MFFPQQQNVKKSEKKTEEKGEEKKENVLRYFVLYKSTNNYALYWKMCWQVEKSLKSRKMVESVVYSC